VFIYHALSYVLHGGGLPDHDFQNVLSMARPRAEQILDYLVGVERTARETGNHWVGVLPEES